MKHLIRFRMVTLVVPRGGALPADVWSGRHRGIVLVLWFHVAALGALGVVQHRSWETCVGSSGLLALCAALSSVRSIGHNNRALFASLGLLLSSAILIDFFSGMIEAHFHFFIVIVVVSLYQSWRPYLLAVGFVLLHHLVLGTLMPHHVYDHAMGMRHPWLLAFIHGGAILVESVACLVTWNLTEDSLLAERKSREELEAVNAQLTRANHAVADLVAMLSHDLRVPVSAVLGYTELAMDAWPTLSSAERLACVERAHNSGLAVQTLLEDTLTVSALDGGGLQPHRHEVDLKRAIGEVVSSLSSQRPDVDLTQVEDCQVLVDERHLGQVLSNLLTNASKYGGGKVAVSALERERDVLIRVSDSGPGVPPEFVARLFDRYSRSSDSIAGKVRGTGLGLYIARALARANGGDLRYEATPGGGATFCLGLPRGADVRRGSLVSPDPQLPVMSSSRPSTAGDTAR